MHYHPLILYLVAVSLCFATRRTGEKPSSTHEDQARLMEDVKDCAQFLDGFNTLGAAPDLVEACERVVVVMGRALEKSTPDLVKRRSKSKHRREEVCEAKVCENEDLEKMCNSQEMDPDAALICKMCYPERNVELINAHCQAKWKRERRAFYIVSFVLMSITILSGLFLYIRRRYLRAKNPPRDEFQDNGPVEQINPPGEIYYYDGTRVDMTMSGERGPPSAEDSSPDARQKDGSKRYNSPWDDYEDDMISTSAAQRRLKQLGLLSRTGRKKIHDLFDLEALRSKYDGTKGIQRQSNDSDRVPVMPWAPNASIRLSDREAQRVRARAFSKGSSAVELRDMPPKNGAV